MTTPLRHLSLAATFAALSASCLLAPALAGAQERQSRDDFQWAGDVPGGKWISVYNINGAISVEPSTSGRVEVRATKSWRRGNPDDVRVEAKKLADGSVAVCALWDERSTCGSDGIDTPRGGSRNRNNDTSIRFRVFVPPDVKVSASTVNGGLTIDGATAEVRAETVNGGIQASSSGGPVRAETVNGSIRVRMGRNDPSTPLSYETVNGSIVVEFPGELDADVELETVNGRLQTDYPVTIQGRMDPRHLRARIGKGGQRIKLTTVNGSVELRRR